MLDVMGFMNSRVNNMLWDADIQVSDLNTYQDLGTQNIDFGGNHDEREWLTLNADGAPPTLDDIDIVPILNNLPGSRGSNKNHTPPSLVALEQDNYSSTSKNTATTLGGQAGIFQLSEPKPSGKCYSLSVPDVVADVLYAPQYSLIIIH